MAVFQVLGVLSLQYIDKCQIYVRRSAIIGAPTLKKKNNKNNNLGSKISRPAGFF